MNTTALLILVIALSAVPLAGILMRINYGKRRARYIFKTISIDKRFLLTYRKSSKWNEIKGEFRKHKVKMYYEKLYTAEDTLKIPSLAVEIETPGIRIDSMAIETMRFFLNSREMDIKFNDNDFDDALLITGTSTVKVRAALNPGARSFIKNFIVHPDFLRLDIRKDTYSSLVKVNLYCGRNLDYQKVIEWLEIIIDFISIITRRGTTEQLLRENYLSEKQPEPKIKYLDSLDIVCSDMDPKDMIITDAMASEHPELMFTAVKAVGGKSYKHIPGIFGKADEYLKIRIIRYAVQKTIKALAPLFGKEFKKLESFQAKKEMLEYFSAVKADSGIEDHLNKLLSDASEAQSDENRDFYEKCVDTLGRCGTKKSIAFLDGLRNKYRDVLINQAIARIQDRIGIGDKGWLSIDGAEKGEGDLSLEGKN